MTTRKVYLEGEMGERFGKEFDMVANSFTEVFRCLKCNFLDFMPYLQECHEKNIHFILEVEGKPIKHEAEALLLYKEGDMVITPVPAGSKSGGAKLLAAIAITVMTAGMGAVVAGGSLAALGGGVGALQAGLVYAAGTIGGQLALGLAVNLAMTGIQQMMAPDPSTDSQQDESYIFEGSKQNIAEGDPVPVLYGELRVPGRTISFHTKSEATSFESLSSGTQYVDSTEETSVGAGIDETEDNITWEDTQYYIDIEFGG